MSEEMKNPRVAEEQELEMLNRLTSERKVNASAMCHSTEEIYRAKKAKAAKKAGVFMVATLLAMMVALVVILSLEKIGWINATFRTVMLCAAGAMAMFKMGYFWHEIKN